MICCHPSWCSIGARQLLWSSYHGWFVYSYIPVPTCKHNRRPKPPQKSSPAIWPLVLAIYLWIKTVSSRDLLPPRSWHVTGSKQTLLPLLFSVLKYTSTWYRAGEKVKRRNDYGRVIGPAVLDKFGARATRSQGRGSSCVDNNTNFIMNTILLATSIKTPLCWSLQHEIIRVLILLLRPPAAGHHFPASMIWRRDCALAWDKQVDFTNS